MKKIIIATIAVFLILAGQALATDTCTDCCMLPTAQGNGLGGDWNNAMGWNVKSGSTFKRGSTYWLGGGTYVPMALSTTCTGSCGTVTIKKATAGGTACNSGTAGWSAAYGTDQAVINSSDPAGQASVIFSSNYWVLDGITNGGWVGAGYGIKLTTSTNAHTHDIMYAAINTHASYITVRNTWIKGYGSTLYACEVGVENEAENPGNNNLVQSNLFESLSNPIVWHSDTDDVVDGNYFLPVWGGGPAACHQETITGAGTYRITISNNIFNPGFIWVHDYSGGSGYNTGWKIYNNLFIGTGAGYSGDFVGCADDGITHPDIFRNFEVHHNTIINWGNTGVAVTCYMTSATAYPTYVYNNLFVNSGVTLASGEDLNPIVPDYNAFYNSTTTPAEAHANTSIAADPFVNDTTPPYDLHLKDATAGTNAQVSCGNNPPTTNPACQSPYNSDRDIVTRSATVPDAGAYEYAGGTTYYTLTVTAPSYGSISSVDGYISCPGVCIVQYASGTGVTLTYAPPSSGAWKLTAWAGDCSGTTCLLAMSGPKGASVTEEKQYYLGVHH